MEAPAFGIGQGFIPISDHLRRHGDALAMEPLSSSACSKRPSWSEGQGGS